MSKNEDNTEGKQEKTKGRPKIKLDVEVLKKLCEIQCTTKEISYIMGCSVDTLNRNYGDVINTGRTLGKVTLRRAQWRNAIEKNNVTMQIWLGKNVLNQTDTPLDEEDGTILPWSD
tara:strand:- start:643 stop:990 length:348 start_codon:yes stop_codon:yes gene_type:complete